MDDKYCYLSAAVGLENGVFEPDGYQSAGDGRIKVNGQFYDYVDPDAHCNKLYEDLIAFYDMINCDQSPYHKNFMKKKVGSLLVLVDEYGTKLSSDYIGPSRYWAHKKGGMDDAEIGEMLLHARTIGGHMLWPVHRIPTINTARGGQNGFYDRIDLTLNEIRYMMLGEPQSKNRMVRRAIEREDAWFALFKAKTGLGQFMRFIDTFHLQPFVFDSDYKVFSLAESDIDQGVYISVSVDEPIFPRDFKRYVKNNLIAIENRRC